MTNDELYDKALESISELFGDTSVSQWVCKKSLESLIEEIQIMLSGLDDAN